MENNSLAHIHLSYYDGVTGLDEWLSIDSPLPDSFLNTITRGESLRELIKEIKAALTQAFGNERRKADSFEESRFTPVDEIVKQKISSCGTITNVVGTALRHFGVPTQFVHGRLSLQGEGDRHAWVKIYDPTKSDWLAIDVTEPTFQMRPDAQEIKTYHNWNELKEDYDRGEW